MTEYSAQWCYVIMMGLFYACTIMLVGRAAIYFIVALADYVADRK